MPSAHVFIQTAFLGDVILSVPFMQNWNYLLGSEPKKILICRQGVGGFIKQLGLVDEVLEIIKGDASSYVQVLKELEKFDINTVISAHQSIRTTLFVRKIKAKNKVGYRNFYSWLAYDKVVDRDTSLPEALRLLQLLIPQDPSLNGLLADYRYNLFPNEYGEDFKLLSPPHWARSQIRDAIVKKANPSALMQKHGLSESKKWIAVFPGSIWATKRWTESGFVGITQQLLKNGFGVALMGGPDEWDLCEKIRQQIPTNLSAGSVNLAGKTSLLESLGLLTSFELTIANDSAGAHLASLAESKVLAIFGPTVLDFGYRPWSDKTFIIEQKDLFCRPCGPHGHKKCPIGTHECMKGIEVKTVLAALGPILNFPEQHNL